MQKVTDIRFCLPGEDKVILEAFPVSNETGTVSPAEGLPRLNRSRRIVDLEGVHVGFLAYGSDVDADIVEAASVS